MLFKIWTDIITAYERITGTGLILVLFIVALFFVFMCDTKMRRNFIPMLLTILATIAYAMTGIIEKSFNYKAENGAIRKFVVFFVTILCLFMVVMSGKRILSPVYLEESDNAMHISQDLIETLDMVLQDEEDSIKVLTVPSYGSYFTAYSARFDMAYDEKLSGDISGFDKSQRVAYEEFGDKNPDMRKVSEAAKDMGCKYIVYPADSFWPELPLSNFGYDFAGGCGRWEIYRVQSGGEE